MRKIFKGILSLGLAIAVCAGTAAFYGSAEYTVADAATTTAATYYNGITAQSGTALLGQLHDLITTSRTKYSSYDECHTKGPDTDPGSASNTVMEFYTQIDISYASWDVSGGWNREHVWPKSDSNGLWKSKTVGGGSDLHHIRPAEKDLNNARGSMKYGEVTNGTARYTSVSNVLGGYSVGSSSTGTFEPLDNVKGDVARILMYVYTHYNTYSNAIFGGNAKTNGSGDSSYFGTLNFTHIITASNEAAAKELLLKWNKSDPVDEIERYRNDAVYGIQGNRNPFIDNESYADAIWGDGTAVDPDPTPSGTLQSLSLNSTSLTLNVGGTFDLTVTPNPSNASKSVNWTSSDPSVATVSNGTVTAKSAGTATITATSTSNSAIKAMATVTVKQSSTSGDTATDKIVITLDSFTPTPTSYNFYGWSAGGIKGTAFIYGNNGCMQFNTSKSSRYIASTTAAPAPIKSVTVTANKDISEWKLLTSDTAYGEVTGAPENGNDRGTQEVTTDGTTWTVSGSDTYFALVREGNGAAYLDSIEVEYGSSGGGSGTTTEDLQEIILSPAEFTITEGAGTKLTVIAVPSTANADVTWTSSDPSVATVSADGTVTAVKAGTATITATSKGNSAIKAAATVTVTAKPAIEIGEKALAFREAVAAIDNESTLSARHTAINVAVKAYNALSVIDKADCAAEIEVLRAAIASYNEAVKANNKAADAADEAALKGAGKLH